MPNQNSVKSALKLDKFKYIWIQKVIGTALPIYLITIDSRYPNVYLSFKSVKNSRTAILSTLQGAGIFISTKGVKLTPPIQLDGSSFTLGSRDVVIVRDIAGDYFSNPKMFEDKNIKILKYEE